MDSPCRLCDHRTPECHADCREYHDWKKELEIGAAARKKERDKTPMLSRTVLKDIWKHMRWK